MTAPAPLTEREARALSDAFLRSKAKDHMTPDLFERMWDLLQCQPCRHWRDGPVTLTINTPTGEIPTSVIRDVHRKLMRVGSLRDRLRNRWNGLLLR